MFDQAREMFAYQTWSNLLQEDAGSESRHESGRRHEATLFLAIQPSSTSMDPDCQIRTLPCTEVCSFRLLRSEYETELRNFLIHQFSY